MTQMADEIRALIADLYDDPEDFLKRPHQWFGGRSPDELMATEAGQFVLLKFLRGEDHMLPIEADRDFKPYTAANTDHAIDQDDRPSRGANRAAQVSQRIWAGDRHGHRRGCKRSSVSGA